MHEHPECDHDLEYCSKCDVVYCTKCKREWGGHNHNWYPYTWTGPIWTSDGAYCNHVGANMATVTVSAKCDQWGVKYG